MHRPRITTRWLVAVIILFAIMTWMGKRRADFFEASRAWQLQAWLVGLALEGRDGKPPVEVTETTKHKQEYFLKLSRKYRAAADRPWLPVPPDPPQPD
jgi:hypothetical protein